MGRPNTEGGQMPRRCNSVLPAALAPLVAVAIIAAGCSGSEEPTAPRGPSSAPKRIAQPPPLVTPPAGSVDEVLVKAPDPKTTEAYGPPGPTDLAKDVSKETERDPTSTSREVSYVDAESVFRAKRYEEATDLFTRYTEQRPNNPWGHYMRGLSAWKGGDLPQAEEAFGHALLLDPHHVKSLLNLSRVLIEQDRTDDALVQLALARDIDPTSGTVHRLLGRTYYAQGTVDDAVDAYRHAIVLDDQDAWSMNNLGLLFLEVGRPGEAVAPLARAVKLRKDVPSFHNNLGMALEHIGRFVAAAKAYDTALEVDPGYDKAWDNLTRVEKVDDDQTGEPFDLEATAKRFVEEMKTWHDEVYAGQ